MSMLNYVPHVLSYPTSLTCLRALRTHVPYVPACVRAFVSSCLHFFTCLHFFRDLRALIFLRALCAFIFLHALRVFIFLRAFRDFNSLKVSNFGRALSAFTFFLFSPKPPPTSQNKQERVICL